MKQEFSANWVSLLPLSGVIGKIFKSLLELQLSKIDGENLSNLRLTNGTILAYEPEENLQKKKQETLYGESKSRSEYEWWFNGVIFTQHFV